MAVHSDFDGPIAVITLDRPEVANAIDRPTADALVDAFRQVDTDASLQVAVLTGAKTQPPVASSQLKGRRRFIPRCPCARRGRPRRCRCGELLGRT